MALRSLKPRVEDATPLTGVDTSLRSSGFAAGSSGGPAQDDALQELLAFATLSQRVHNRTALVGHEQQSAADIHGRQSGAEPFGLDEVLQLVTDYAVEITGAHGAAIALAENDEIVLRASSGTIAPDLDARIDRASAFSGACIRTAQMVSCDDTETDPRVNLEACRQLRARSMVAVPLQSPGAVFGVLEAFSAWPAGFTPDDFRNLNLLAELVSRALTPEEETRLTESAQVAAAKLSATSVKVASAADVPGVEGEVTAARAVTAHAREDQLAEDIKPVESAVVGSAIVESAIVESAIDDTPAAWDEPVPQEIRAAAIVESMPSLQARVEERGGAGRRSPVLVLLCVGIAVVFAAGIWWMRARHARLTTPGQKIQSKQAAQEHAATGAGVHAAIATARPEGGSAKATMHRASRPAGLAKANTEAVSETGPPAASATLQEMLKYPRITGIHPQSGPDSTTVVINLESPVEYESHRLTGPDRIYFDLRATQLPPELFGKSIEFHDARLRRIRVAQPVAGLTRVVLETRGTPAFSASIQQNPCQLVIQLRAEP